MLTYELAPALPVGLSFNPQTRVISGTPTQLHGATGYSYTARHENGETATLTFTIAVTAATVHPPGTGATDREILVAFYHATGGPNWKNNTNWLSDKRLSDWYGVRDNILLCPPPSFQCDPADIAAARVTDLYLPNNGLTGPIPPEIGKLSELRTLRLNENKLRGPIPSSLGQLPNLWDIDLGQKWTDWPDSDRTGEPFEPPAAKPVWQLPDRVAAAGTWQAIKT